jgi:sugar phosphate isomerase/epimerase
MAWAMRGGFDPLDILKKLGPKCDMVHQKDISKTVKHVNLFEVITKEDDNLGVLETYLKYVDKGDFVDLGHGIFDFEKVYKGIAEMGYVKYAFAENESANEDRFKSAENDYQVMRKWIEKI